LARFAANARDVPVTRNDYVNKLYYCALPMSDVMTNAHDLTKAVGTLCLEDSNTFRLSMPVLRSTFNVNGILTVSRKLN